MSKVSASSLLSGVQTNVRRHSAAINKLQSVVEELDWPNPFQNNLEQAVDNAVSKVDNLHDLIAKDLSALSTLLYHSDVMVDNDAGHRLSPREMILLNKLKKDFAKAEVRAADLPAKAAAAIENRRKTDARESQRRQQLGFNSDDSDEEQRSVRFWQQQTQADHETQRLLIEESNIEQDLDLDHAMLQQRNQSIHQLHKKMVQIQDAFSELNSIISEQTDEVSACTTSLPKLLPSC